MKPSDLPSAFTGLVDRGYLVIHLNDRELAALRTGLSLARDSGDGWDASVTTLATIAWAELFSAAIGKVGLGFSLLASEGTRPHDVMVKQLLEARFPVGLSHDGVSEDHFLAIKKTLLDQVRLILAFLQQSGSDALREEALALDKKVTSL